jgi:alpha-glucoside transport system substrate-binding protein
MAVGKRRRRLAGLGMGISLALATTGCLQGGDNSSSGSGGSGGSSEGDGTVTILGAFGGAEQDAFEASLKGFEDDSGIDIQYTADTDFTTTVVQRVKSGDAPDIGLFPQPGGLLELSDNITPLDQVIDVDAIKKTLIPGFLDAATADDGTVYGAPMRMAVKSIVWYPKPQYEDAGYNTQPKTFQELLAESKKIAADGTAPWCIGWESDQATGWVGTDWLEEMVLRVAGPDVYDQWVKHEIPFDDPQIVKALDAAGQIEKDPDLVLGGTKGILATAFADAMTPAFQDKPECYLMRQGNFATGFFPEDVQADLDGSVGTFYFPAYEGGYDGQPLLGGGDLAAAFNGGDSDVKKVMEFLTSDQFGAEWAKAGGWLSPHSTFDASNYADETTRNIAKLAADADVFRFDASDLMPKEVGSGTFWTGMVDWLEGESSEDALKAIEDSWPAS